MPVVICAANRNKQGINCEIDHLPDECPVCRRGLEISEPVFSALIDRPPTVFIELACRCPRADCARLFVSTYFQPPLEGTASEKDMRFLFVHSVPYTYEDRVFGERIKEISPTFAKTWNQSSKAETDGLLEICGPGYRKALEFLIKDYLVHLYPDRVDDIKKKLLGRCISDDVKDVNLKACASRAAWLGNDETHYDRRWEAHDLQDLKTLIELSVRWIESELLTAQYKGDMPDSGPPARTAD